MKKTLILSVCLLLAASVLCFVSCDESGASGHETGAETESCASPSEQPTDPVTDPEDGTDAAGEPDSEIERPTTEPTAAQTDAPTEPPTDTPTEIPTEAPTETPTEVPTEAPTEAPTEPATEPDPELPGEDNVDRLHRVLDDHNDHIAHTTYSEHTEQINRSVMSFNGDVSESTETEAEDILHLTDGSLYSALCITDDYDTYTEKTWFIDGMLYDDNSSDGRYKVRLNEEEYDAYNGGTYGTMDEIIDLLTNEDISIRWDKDSSSFMITFEITDQDRLNQLMSDLLGDEADEVELSDMAFDGHLIVDLQGRILEDKVRLGYAMSIFGITMNSESTSTESFVYNDSITITPPEDPDSFAELTPEEFFGE